MLKAKHLHNVAMVIGAVGLLLGVLGVITSGTQGLVVLVNTALLSLLFLFASAVLAHLEAISAALAQTPVAPAGASNPYVEERQYTIPRPPAKNEAQRNKALQDIKATGFKSTQKVKAADYLAAIDNTRGEWVIVPPDGRDVKIRPRQQFRCCELNRDCIGGQCAALEVRVYTTDADYPAHIVLYRQDVRTNVPHAELEQEAECLMALLNSLSTSEL